MCPFSSLAFLQPTTVDKEPIFRVGRGLEKLVDFFDIELFGNVHTYL